MPFLAGQILTADALNTALGDTGVLTNLAITPATNWAILVNEHRVVGKVMELRLQIQNNTGAAVTANATGNVSPGVVMATITDVTKRPVMQKFPIGQGSTTSGCLEIRAATGEIVIEDLHSSSSIANGATVEFSTTYTIA